jgi:hypothetical protein
MNDTFPDQDSQQVSECERRYQGLKLERPERWNKGGDERQSRVCRYDDFPLCYIIRPKSGDPACSPPCGLPLSL